MWLPAGSELTDDEAKAFALSSEDMTSSTNSHATASNIVAMATQFLGAPYLWGGRTTMGIDCSGLSQLAYKLCGIALPRDASQQVLCGELLDDAEDGCLAFFNNDEGRIVHVGIVDDAASRTIIHASGQVKRSHFDDYGILADGSTPHHRLYSHQLCCFRSVIRTTPASNNREKKSHFTLILIKFLSLCLKRRRGNPSVHESFSSDRQDYNTAFYAIVAQQSPHQKK